MQPVAHIFLSLPVLAVGLVRPVAQATQGSDRPIPGKHQAPVGVVSDLSVSCSELLVGEFVFLTCSAAVLPQLRRCPSSQHEQPAAAPAFHVSRKYWSPGVQLLADARGSQQTQPTSQPFDVHMEGRRRQLRHGARHNLHPRLRKQLKVVT